MKLYLDALHMLSVIRGKLASPGISYIQGEGNKEANHFGKDIPPSNQHEVLVNLPCNINFPSNLQDVLENDKVRVVDRAKVVYKSFINELINLLFKKK